MNRWANVIGTVEALLWVGLVAIVWSDDAEWPIALFLAVTLAVGWVLAARMPGHPMGWLLLAIPGFFLLAVPAQLVGESLLDTNSSLASWMLWYGGDRDTAWIWLPPVGLLFTQVLLLFPDGQLPSIGWRPFQRFTIAALAYGTVMFAMIDSDVAPGLPNPIGWIDQESPLLAASVFLPLLVSFAGSAWSLVWRYRRAAEAQREQIKWVVLAAGVVVAFFLLTLPFQQQYLFTFVALSYSLIPVSIGVAVLKYRLYEIDRIVSRTASYALVTGLLLGAYFVIVTSLTTLLPKSSNGFAVAAATLAAAAAFRPVLSRVQKAVDRRFDRERYDGLQAAEAFSARLRDETDPDAVSAEMTAVVQRTLQPGRLLLWIPGDVADER
ncbi:MAG TPA: hypothetical protein VES02_05355 [Dermatophilaceae bacterium]|nr:hypothetical protein [Dermatophilaceae bacterium]